MQKKNRLSTAWFFFENFNNERHGEMVENIREAEVIVSDISQLTNVIGLVEDFSDSHRCREDITNQNLA